MTRGARKSTETKVNSTHLLKLRLKLKVGFASLDGYQQFWQLQIPFLGE